MQSVSTNGQMVRGKHGSAVSGFHEAAGIYLPGFGELGRQPTLADGLDAHVVTPRWQIFEAPGCICDDLVRDQAEKGWVGGHLDPVGVSRLGIPEYPAGLRPCAQRWRGGGGVTTKLWGAAKGPETNAPWRVSLTDAARQYQVPGSNAGGVSSQVDRRCSSTSGWRKSGVRANWIWNHWMLATPVQRNTAELAEVCWPGAGDW